jgi:hypothetical protein
MRLIPKEIESLWTLFTAPTIWALHFLACYITAATYCAKAGAAPFSFETMRLALGAVTVAALGGIVLSAFLAWRQWGFGFQGFATLLLSGLSFAAVLFVAVPLVFIEACQP